jgi:hypothetical protein
MSKSKSGFEALLSRHFERLLEEDPVFRNDGSRVA